MLPSPELQVNSQSSQLWQKDLKVGVMGWFGDQRVMG